MGGSKLDMLDLNDSKADLFMYLIEGIRIDTWKVQHLISALDLFPKTTLTWLAWGYTWLSPYDPKFGDKEIEVKNNTNLLGHKAND